MESTAVEEEEEVEKEGTVHSNLLLPIIPGTMPFSFFAKSIQLSHQRCETSTMNMSPESSPLEHEIEMFKVIICWCSVIVAFSIIYKRREQAKNRDQKAEGTTEGAQKQYSKTRKKRNGTPGEGGEKSTGFQNRKL